MIKSDFSQFKTGIAEYYKQYKPGDKLVLNNKAIVEWIGIKEKKFIGQTFRTKATKDSQRAEITIDFSNIIMLQRAPSTQKALSSLNKVKTVLPSQNKRNITEIELLLDFDSFGNLEFIKNKICLVSKFSAYDDSNEGILVNQKRIENYFNLAKIDEGGKTQEISPLLISNNLSPLLLYLTQFSNVSKIIIDGYSAINERGTDFSDIDSFKIPTILITDLSEIHTFENIGNYGFDFFNFTKEHLYLDTPTNRSPFDLFENKLTKYISFKLNKEVCSNIDIENIARLLHSLPLDDSNDALNQLHRSLIQIVNITSRICHKPADIEVAHFVSEAGRIEDYFLKNKLWLGAASKPLEEIIDYLKHLIESLSHSPIEKNIRLHKLLAQNNYDYIVCPTDAEAMSLNIYFANHKVSKIEVISITDVNDKLISDRPVKAILTGWPKSSNFNRIVSAFLFSEITVLFYGFECKYYNSLQTRNRRYSENIKTTINKDGIRLGPENSSVDGFQELYLTEEVVGIASDINCDVVDYESKIDITQYSKYLAPNNLTGSCKAKRVDFENNTFTFATESHKFLEISELLYSVKEHGTIHRKNYESLKSRRYYSVY